METRPIKFRAWDNINQKMFDVETIDFSLDKVFIGNEVGKRFWSHYSIDGLKRGCELMQFTGLLDKNGKEIYEGDIMRSDYKNIILGFVHFMPHGIFAIVRSKKAKRWTDMATSSENGKIWVSAFEVIGNIYENPELIK